MSTESAMNESSNREAQKYLLLGVFVLSISYMAVTTWIPDVLYYWRNFNNKRQILNHVKTEGVKKAADQLQKLENERQEKQDKESSMEVSSNPVERNPDFVLKHRVQRNDSTETKSASVDVGSSNEEGNSDTKEVKRVVRSLPKLSPYAPPPVIQKSPEEIALERSRKLKRQQDLAYQRSVEEDEKKLQAQLEKKKAQEAKKERIDIVKATASKKRTFAEGEKTVRLSFRYGAARAGNNKGPSQIRNGDILENTVMLKNVVNVFSSSDTVEYLLDYVEGQDHIMKLRPTNSAVSSEDSENFFELSLSYPMRTISRTTDPSTTLQDLAIENDSVVWITFV